MCIKAIKGIFEAQSRRKEAFSRILFEDRHRLPQAGHLFSWWPAVSKTCNYRWFSAGKIHKPCFSINSDGFALALSKTM